MAADVKNVPLPNASPNFRQSVGNLTLTKNHRRHTPDNARAHTVHRNCSQCRPWIDEESTEDANNDDDDEEIMYIGGYDPRDGTQN